MNQSESLATDKAHNAQVTARKMEQLVELEFDMQRARERQKQLMKTFPMKVSYREGFSNPRKKLVELYAPDCVGEGAINSAYFDAPEKHKRNVDLGYEPVVVNGEQIRSGSDLMYKRPIQFKIESIKKAEQLSRDRFFAQSSDMHKYNTEGVQVESDQFEVLDNPKQGRK